MVDWQCALSFCSWKRLIGISVGVLALSACSIGASQGEASGDSGETGISPSGKQTLAAAAGETGGAFDGSLNGRLIYEKACASCHANGFNGAPRLVASDWPYHEELGVDHYTYNAIAGIGIMPPRGGRRDLTDEQVRQAVRYMLNQLE